MSKDEKPSALEMRLDKLTKKSLDKKLSGPSNLTGNEDKKPSPLNWIKTGHTGSEKIWMYEWRNGQICLARRPTNRNLWIFRLSWNRRDLVPPFEVIEDGDPMYLDNITVRWWWPW